jgi:small-conductance mechanosensitive channel
MNTNITGKASIDTLAASVTALISRPIEHIFGPAAVTPRFGNVSWADLCALLCLLLLALLVNGMVASFLRRKIREAEAQPESKEWHTEIWRTVAHPLYLLIWVYGACLATAPVLLKLPSAHGPHPARLLFDKAFDVGVFVVVFWLFFKLTHVLEERLQTWAGKTESKLDDLIVPLLGQSLRVIVPVVGLIFSLPLIGLSPETSGVLAKGSSILIIGAVAWILFQAVSLCEKVVLAQHDITAADNLQARRVYTQVHVLSKTLYFIIGIFTAASVLMLFDEVRRFGASILASAGVVGIIIGFAAQRTIANLFAGFQLAMTQPIRLDDVVIVEGEWGRIEEITLTYVVVHIWDDRRLVVPLSHFIEKPFQNWTRASAELLGSVCVWVDYSLPVDDVRDAVQRIVAGSPLWDKRFWNVQVTESTDRAMQIRVLATASDSSKTWDLRCDIREKLIGNIQKHYPRSLPRLRTDMSRPSSGAARPECMPPIRT